MSLENTKRKILEKNKQQQLQDRISELKHLRELRMKKLKRQQNSC